MKYDIVIIGSGLGGLECGYILSKKGLKVCVLERANLLGGCLQSFHRGNCLFDTGFHYVGGLDEGQSLNRLFKYFNLMNLDWVKMDNNFDDVCINGKTYPFVSGHDNFRETLSSYFPHQKENLKAYTNFLQNVGTHTFDSFKPRSENDFYSSSLFAQSAHEFLNNIISDPVLRDVLAGTSLKMELSEQLPLYVFAQINDSYIQSAWRLQGGGFQIAESLANSIIEMGGEIRKNSAVTRMIETNGKITSVEINNNEFVDCSWVISNAHPIHTISLIPEESTIRKLYRNRINRMENTFGVFTANIKLKSGSVKYKNKNLYAYHNADLWKYTEGKTDRALVSFYCPKNDDSCDCLDILTPMNWNEVEAWSDKPIGKRGEDYVAMKNKKTGECIKLVSQYIPELEEAVERAYTSTPLSYRNYTNTANGSAYGVRKDFNSPMLTILPAKTPIPNLLMTGQNLNLHGVLGVSMTSFFTCAEIVGMDTLIKDLDINE